MRNRFGRRERQERCPLLRRHFFQQPRYWTLGCVVVLPFPEYYWRRTRRSVSVIDQPAARPVYGQFSLGYGPILIGFIAGLIELKRQQHPRGASVSHGNVVL